MAKAQDKFPAGPAHQQDPIYDAFEVTPSDTDELPYITRSVFVGTGGNMRVTLECKNGNDIGQSILYINLPSGAQYPWRVRKIWATDTTADNIVGEH